MLRTGLCFLSRALKLLKGATVMRGSSPQAQSVNRGVWGIVSAARGLGFLQSFFSQATSLKDPPQRRILFAIIRAAFKCLWFRV